MRPGDWNHCPDTGSRPASAGTLGNHCAGRDRRVRGRLPGLAIQRHPGGALLVFRRRLAWLDPVDHRRRAGSVDLCRLLSSRNRELSRSRWPTVPTARSPTSSSLERRYVRLANCDFLRNAIRSRKAPGTGGLIMRARLTISLFFFGSILLATSAVPADEPKDRPADLKASVAKLIKQLDDRD